MQLIDDLKEYVNIRLQLVTLTVCELMSQVLASLVANVAMLFFIFLFILFGSIAGGFALGQCLGSTALGFAIVASFYLLVAVVILLIKKRLVEKPLVNMFVKMFLKNLADKEDEKS